MNKAILNGCLETKFRLRGINRCVFTSLSSIDYVYPYRKQYILVFKDTTKANLRITGSVLKILTNVHSNLKVLDHDPTSI